MANVRNGLMATKLRTNKRHHNPMGNNPVNGMLQTQARNGTFENGNTNQLATATAIWTTNTSRPISSVASKENFTYTFYSARLNNASVSTLSTGTSAFNYFLNGTWNVYTVTSNVTIITNSTGQHNNSPPNLRYICSKSIRRTYSHRQLDQIHTLQ